MKSLNDYLDLSIFIDTSINRKGATFSTYDKRRAFGFDIIKFPHANSCGHTITGSGCMKGQILRYSKTCEFYRIYKVQVRILLQDFLFRGWSLTMFLT